MGSGMQATWMGNWRNKSPWQIAGYRQWRPRPANLSIAGCTPPSCAAALQVLCKRLAVTCPQAQSVSKPVASWLLPTVAASGREAASRFCPPPYVRPQKRCVAMRDSAMLSDKPQRMQHVLMVEKFALVFRL